MKVSIVIVSWNVKDILSDCINSILQYICNFPFEIIVVDNCGSDGTADYIRKKFPAGLL
jgi:glycosyltransferase involved in cell wall biosynthesis